MSVSSIGVVMT